MACGLIGYVLVPTAPPWMFASYGFVDGVNHASGLGAMANPYAAMPSLHAADALIVGYFLFTYLLGIGDSAPYAAFMFAQIVSPPFGGRLLA